MTRTVSFADAHAAPDAVVNAKCCRSTRSKVARPASHQKLRVRRLPATKIPPPIDRVDATNRVDAIAGHVANVRHQHEVSARSRHAVSARSHLAETAHEASQLEAKLAVAIPREATRAVATQVGRIAAHAQPAVERMSQQQDRFPALKRDAPKVSAATTISLSSMTTMSTVLAAA